MPLTLFWLDGTRVPLNDRNIGYMFGGFFLATAVASAGAAILVRVITLASGWHSFRFRSLALGMAGLSAIPLMYFSVILFGEWQQREPSDDCMARTSFAVQIASEEFAIPNWPIVMVSSGAANRPLSTNTGLRDLCEQTSGGRSYRADSVTFFFEKVTSRRSPELENWLETECQRKDSAAAPLVCDPPPLEQVSIYPDEDFPGRGSRYGSSSSHALFLARQAEGKYDRDEGTRHKSSVEYADGTWVFNDGTAFFCEPRSEDAIWCLGDFLVTDKMLAKVEFIATPGSVEAGHSLAKQALNNLLNR